MFRYFTGAAAIALIASAAVAQNGNGNGKGGGGNPGGGKDRGSVQAPGGGNGGGNGGGKGGAKHDAGHGAAAARADNGAANGNGKAKNPAADRADDRPRGRSAEAAPRSDGGAKGNGKPQETRGNSGDRGAGRELVRDDRGGLRGDDRGARSDWRWASAVPAGARGLVDGCPPGLARKDNGCNPPGQVRSRAAFYDRPEWWDFDRRWFGGVNWDGDYRYRDGYLVRYGSGGVDAWIPLLGGALAPGNLWPGDYAPVAAPDYYRSYYGLGGDDSYRYYDDTFYGIDPQTQAITGIIGLLTGNDFAVGQTLPAGYDVYNVPYSLRDRYVDGPEAAYRYSDGYIYEVDPTTQLIQAAIELIA